MIVPPNYGRVVCCLKYGFPARNLSSQKDRRIPKGNQSFKVLTGFLMALPPLLLALWLCSSLLQRAVISGGGGTVAELCLNGNNCKVTLYVTS